MKQSTSSIYTTLIPCGKELAAFVATEVEALSLSVISQHGTGVVTKATWQDMLRLNLWLRTGLSVLILLKEFVCRNPEELYREINAYPWETIIQPNDYLSVVSRVDKPTIKNTMFANQKVKDAICDRMKQKTGTRPDAGPERDAIVIDLFWKDTRCWLYFNTSGRKLADRGYRKQPHTAPLQETLAAAILMASGYDGRQPLVIPMCGSGTLAIEAALIARRFAPGLLRSNFGFMHHCTYVSASWQELVQDARGQIKTRAQPIIISSDHDPAALSAARANANAAGVSEMIRFEQSDFRATPLPASPGIIIFNPPYGERLGKPEELGELYSAIGDFLKQRCTGYTAFVLTANLELAKKIGLRTSKRQLFFNADKECRLLRYELYAGSGKKAEETNA